MDLDTAVHVIVDPDVGRDERREAARTIDDVVVAGGTIPHADALQELTRRVLCDLPIRRARRAVVEMLRHDWSRAA